MNRFNPNHLNGWSNAIDNLYFLEQLVTDGFKALVRNVGLDAEYGFKIDGAVATTDGAGGFNVSAGWIWLEGEILAVEAHTAAGPLGGGEEWYWTVEETNDSASEDEDVDGNPIYVVKKRRGKLVRGAEPASYMPKDAISMSEAMREAETTTWTTVTLSGALTGSLKYRKRMGNLEFKGLVQTNGDDLSFMLPASFWPESSRQLFIVRPATTTVPTYSAWVDGMFVTVSQTGEVSFGSSSENFRLAFDGVSIPLD